MISPSTILTFFLGGITVPLAFLVLLWLGSRPIIPPNANPDSTPDIAYIDDSAEKTPLKPSQGDPPTAAGYFAVCREYVPAGINGKPPERSTPAGDVQLGTSPSVYQSMYNSIFDRGKTTTPSIDGEKKEGQRTKKARNVFYVALRHDHLLLFDTEQQLDVRHVISLLHHQVDIYAGGEAMSEGDLFIKRNCIRLQRHASAEPFQPASKPFYLFSDNCSEKEDFYHALLAAQAASSARHAPASPMKYEPPHMLKLVQALHTSDADPHLKWLNALIGRLFLGLYKVQQLEDIVKAKITRKIDRVPKPTFVSSVSIQSVDIGDAAPVFSNIKLKELNIDEDVVIEADVKYNGGFRLQTAAIARLDLGQRFRAREVTLLLAVVLKRLSGHMLIRIKAPPSNRIWVAFETMPNVELSIEPIVSSRQITYSVILRAIESRIREVLAETIVLPNWDDFPFLDTADMAQRGGIWRHHTSPVLSEEPQELDETASGHLETITLPDTDAHDAPSENAILEERSMSVPIVKETPFNQVVSRKGLRNSKARAEPEAASSGSSMASIAASKALTNIGQLTPRSTSVKVPKAMRSPSFAATASPIVSTDDARPSARRSDSSETIPRREAVDLIKDVKQRSDSFGQRPSSSDGGQAAASDFDRQSVQSADTSPDQTLPISSAAKPEGTSQDSLPSSKQASTTSLASTINSSTAAAKQWGWNVISRSSPSRSGGSNDVPSGSQRSKPPSSPKIAPTSTASPSSSSFAKTFAHMRGSSIEADKLKLPISEPMGRGQPLPAPGQPLPGPSKPGWGTVLGGFKKKTSVSGSSGAGTPASSNAAAGQVGAGTAAGPGNSSAAITAALSAASGAEGHVPRLPPRRAAESVESIAETPPIAGDVADTTSDAVLDAGSSTDALPTGSTLPVPTHEVDAELALPSVEPGDDLEGLVDGATTLPASNLDEFEAGVGSGDGAAATTGLGSPAEDKDRESMVGAT